MSVAWQPYLLVPDDVLFFRDGRPSTIGADHYLRSLFPPFPSTLYGAVRTRRLVEVEPGVDLTRLGREAWSKLPETLRQELGEWCGFGTVELRGPWLIKDGQAAMPAPADLALVMKGRDQAVLKGGGESAPAWARIEHVVRYRFEEDHTPAKEWSHALACARPYFTENGREASYPAQGAGKAPKPAEGWSLDVEGMKAWLAGGIPAASTFIHKNELWLDEVRTGVGLRSGQRSSGEGMLYTFGFVRLQRAKPGPGPGRGGSLGFELRHGKLDAAGFLRLGGEGRTAAVTAGTPFPHDSPSALGDKFLVYFATPTLSDGGAYPPGFSAERLEGELGGVRCRLLGAIVRGRLLVGGWDLAKSAPKPLRRAIPAGSVFMFEAERSEQAQAAQSIHGQNVSGFPEEHLAQQGFGLALVAPTT